VSSVLLLLLLWRKISLPLRIASMKIFPSRWLDLVVIVFALLYCVFSFRNCLVQTFILFFVVVISSLFLPSSSSSSSLQRILFPPGFCKEIVITSFFTMLGDDYCALTVSLCWFFSFAVSRLSVSRIFLVVICDDAS
jgi:hypothetical protein